MYNVPRLPDTDQQVLQQGARSLTDTTLTAVVVGRAQISLVFSDKSSIDLQCPFEIYDDQGVYHGHGCTSATAVNLFRFLNLNIALVEVSGDRETTLTFSESSGIRIKSEETGYESYILNTAGSVYVFY